jgi:hypothetical protein
MEKLKAMQKPRARRFAELDVELPGFGTIVAGPTDFEQLFDREK